MNKGKLLSGSAIAGDDPFGTGTIISAAGGRGKTFMADHVGMANGEILIVAMEVSASGGAPKQAGADMATRVDAERKKRARNEAEKKAREALVRTALQELVTEHGDVVTIISVANRWSNSYTITLLQWLGHGLGGRRMDEVSFGSHDSELTDDLIRKTLRTKYARALAHQSKLGETLGRARMPSADDVDLGAYQIEQPLAAVLRRILGDNAPARLRELLAKGQEGYLPTGSQDDLVGGSITIRTARGVIRGEFEVRVDERTSIAWSKGGLRLKDVVIPTTLAISLSTDAIKRIGDIVEHPLLDGEIAVTSVQTVAKTDRIDVAMSTKDSEIAMPADWLRAP